MRKRDEEGGESSPRHPSLRARPSGSCSRSASGEPRPQSWKLQRPILPGPDAGDRVVGLGDVSEAPDLLHLAQSSAMTKVATRGDPPSVRRLRRSISVPDIEGGVFIAHDDDGTVLECSLLAPLLRRVVDNLAERPIKASWTLSFQPFEGGVS